MMVLPDVNILVYAHRDTFPQHAAIRTWLQGQLNGESSVALADVVASGFLRVATHPRNFDPPTRLDEALAFIHAVRTHPGSIRVVPGERHWSIFERLCRSAEVKGNLVPDAYIAALAIEHGCELITTDRDFARFPGLRWRHPLG